VRDAFAVDESAVAVLSPLGADYPHVTDRAASAASLRSRPSITATVLCATFNS
jgi:hypothetical protein